RFCQSPSSLVCWPDESRRGATVAPRRRLVFGYYPRQSPAVQTSHEGGPCHRPREAERRSRGRYFGQYLQTGGTQEVRVQMRYAVVIEKAENNYSAYVPDLPGCVATGTTVAEAEMQIREAIEFHLEGMREDGLPIPLPSSQVEYIEIVA